MKELKFNEKFLNPIYNEDKTATIRTKDKGLKAGETVKPIFIGTQHSHTETELQLRIKSITIKQLSDIDDSDVRSEGYTSTVDLINELGRIYPYLKLGDIIYIYEFQLTPPIKREE